MTRIPDSDIERLKRDVSLQRLVQGRGIVLKRHGADLIGLCPLHDDKQPSLVVSPAKNLWHCLGACQTGGSVIDWVMKAEGLSFRDAVEKLRANFSPLAASPDRAAPMRVDLEIAEEEVMRQAVAYYHETLRRAPEALAYLERRGLRYDEMIDHFCLGFANRTLTEHVGALSRHGSANVRAHLQNLGLVRASGHEHLAGAIVVPIFNADRHVTEIYGRKIGDDLREGTPVHLYLPGPHRGVFNEQALAGAEEVILCEALLDALTFWQAGYRNVTSSYGIEGFTSEHLAAFKKHGTRRVLIAYDADLAGDRAAETLAEKLQAEGLGCYRIRFPKGMDANEYALKVEPASKSLGILIRSAMWMGKSEAPVVTRGEIRAERAAKEGNGTATPCRAAEAIAVNAEEIVVVFDDRRYRVRGLMRNPTPEQLRVNLMCSRGARFHIDTLDLYAARHRGAYLKQAAHELEVEESVLKEDLTKLLRQLEETKERTSKPAREPKSAAAVMMTEDEKREALSLLRDPRLLDRILADFHHCGLVGEETSKLVGYLAAVSRKLEEPLALIIQSASAAGKTSLMESILRFMPEEEQVKYSAMTGQSLFYMGETDLKHKILAVVEEAGAQRASYALKLLQSEGELTIASTGKDPQTGRLVTHEYHVEGPVMLLLTTTAVEIDEELLNRCLVLTVNESREQTRAIHKLQRERQTLEGLLARQERDRTLRMHCNAQRLLRPLLVANPYARELTFLDDRTRTRRDHVKYLTLIRCIALLHQHQREVKTIVHDGRKLEYIEVTLEDIALANRLAHEVLGRSLDELAPQTRRLLVLLDERVRTACGARRTAPSEYRFTRREVREHTGWSYDQVRVHLERLVAMEYVLVHHGGRGQSVVYELVYDGQGKDGRPFLAGLLDVEALRERCSPTRSLGGSTGGFGGALGAHWGAIGVGLGSGKNGTSPLSARAQRVSAPENAKNAPTAARNSENGRRGIPHLAASVE